MACGNQLILDDPIARPTEPSTARMTFHSTLELYRVTIPLWLARARQRRALCGLDEHLLSDIGVAPEAAEREWRKPFRRASDDHQRRKPRSIISPPLAMFRHIRPPEERALQREAP